MTVTDEPGVTRFSTPSAAEVTITRVPSCATGPSADPTG